MIRSPDDPISLACPESFCIVLANCLELLCGGFGGLLYVRRYLQLPSGVGQDIVHRHAGMNTREMGFAAVILGKAQYTLGGDHGRRATARQTNALEPSCAF